MRIALNHRRISGLAIAAVAFVAVMTTPGHVLAQRSIPTVVAPVSVYATLSAQWWQWILGIPGDTNPGFDDGSDMSGQACAVHQSGPVWFLAGTFVGGPVERRCTVPAGKALFFPLINQTWIFDPGEVRTADFVRTAIAPGINNVDTLRATLDSLNVKDLFGNRVLSPLFSYVLPENNIVGLPAGRYGPTASDGYWLLVAPLSPGLHTISFGGTIGAGFAVDVTYKLNVAEQR